MFAFMFAFAFVLVFVGMVGVMVTESKTEEDELIQALGKVTTGRRRSMLCSIRLHSGIFKQRLTEKGYQQAGLFYSRGSDPPSRIRFIREVLFDGDHQNVKSC